MNSTVERSSLLKTLLRTTRIVDKRNTIPILNNVLLVAKDSVLRLKATDLDMEITDALPCDIQLDGAITLPAGLFTDIVKKLPAGSQIKIVTADDGASVTITAGKSRFKLQVLPASDFPDITIGAFSHTFALPASDLKRLLTKTQFAISTEETRYYLNGVFFHTFEGNLLACGTDGHKLSLAWQHMPDGSDGMPGVIVPRRAIGELVKLVEEGNVGVEMSDAKVRFTFDDGLVLTTKLIDGTFPDYQRVIPKGNDKTLTVERLVLAGAADCVSTISSERGRGVKVELSDGEMTLTVSSPDAGVATEALSVIYADDPLEIGFNSKYLAEALTVIEGDQVIVKLADPGSPALLNGSGDADSLIVIMPMRV